MDECVREKCDSYSVLFVSSGGRRGRRRRGRTLQEDEDSMSNSGGIHLKNKKKKCYVGVHDLDNDMMSE